MKIYVATSWRNEAQPGVVRLLRGEGYEVYDFRNPAPGNKGFHWSDIDPDWKNWNPCKFANALSHEVAVKGFDYDMRALQEADVVVLVMPCGRSAHLELGYAIGAGKPSAILLSDGEPELMYKMVEGVGGELFCSEDELLGWLENISN